MPRVLITPPEMLTAEGPPHRLLKQAGFEIVYPPPGVRLFTEELLLEHLIGVDAVLAGMEPFTQPVLAGSRLRAIARFGVGYDAIDVAAATEHGVVLAIAAGANQVSVAEHTLALLLAVFRTITSRDRKIRAGQWERTNVPRLAGRTIGLVGLGRIGRAVATRAQSLGLRVIAHDPHADKAFASAYAIPLLSIDELLSSADIVSLHCPCTPETRHLIDARQLARMKPDAVLINTARGGLVDEPALIAALESGKLFGAGLDTFEVEPLPASSPLCRMDNVVLTPHGAGVDEQAVRDISLLSAQNIASLYQGRWPEECVVNRQLRDGWKW